MNAAPLLSIREAASMLHREVGDVRKMVIEDRTLVAVHVDRIGFQKPFELRGLQLCVVDDLGVISNRGTGKEATGFLRFDLAEVVRVLSERAHEESKPSAIDSNSNSNSTIPDPERRLARLRELGGNATYRHGAWKMTGISALFASEKSEGRKRKSPKTVREDLKEAAENEREAKRANAFSQLGQR